MTTKILEFAQNNEFVLDAYAQVLYTATGRQHTNAEIANWVERTGERVIAFCAAVSEDEQSQLRFLSGAYEKAQATESIDEAVALSVAGTLVGQMYASKTPENLDTIKGWCRQMEDI